MRKKVWIVRIGCFKVILRVCQYFVRNCEARFELDLENMKSETLNIMIIFEFPSIRRFEKWSGLSELDVSKSFYGQLTIFTKVLRSADLLNSSMAMKILLIFQQRGFLPFLENVRSTRIRKSCQLQDIFATVFHPFVGALRKMRY